MDKETLKLECLREAMKQGPKTAEEALKAARQFYDFTKDTKD